MKDGIVTMDDYEAEFQDYPTSRPEGYYDLIELPNGRHVPVPIAERLVGEAIIERIPVSRKHRNKRFFYCIECDKFQEKLWKDVVPRQSIIDGTDPYSPGYSFFRCQVHKPTSKEENDAKEAMLVRLILNGMYRTLRYVEAEH